MNAHILFLALAIAVPGLACAQSTSASRYGASEALSVHDARLGEVLMVRQVTLQNDRSVNTGSAIGAAVGYAAAQQVEGSYRDAARVAGTVIGGVAGTSVQRGLSGRKAIEIYVRDVSSNGRVVVIVQDHTDGIQQGDRVFLVGSGSTTRVVRVPVEAGISDNNRIGLTGLGNFFSPANVTAIGSQACSIWCPFGPGPGPGCTRAQGEEGQQEAWVGLGTSDGVAHGSIAGTSIGSGAR